MQEIHNICDILEDKSSFSPKEIVNILSYVIEQNPELVSTDKKNGQT